MGEAAGLYRVGLNLNSITTSPTMLSRRVFELLAAGTPVISAPSPALSRFFGDDLVRVASSPEETRFHLESLLGDYGAWQSLSRRGVKCVLEKDTYWHRLGSILHVLGIGGEASDKEIEP
ncbi:MAG: glycosyltransferase [Myxococcota bacterium]